MKKIKLLFAISLSICFSNLGWAQWKSSSNDIYNTNYTTTPPGKVGIGLTGREVMVLANRRMSSLNSEACLSNPE